NPVSQPWVYWAATPASLSFSVASGSTTVVSASTVSQLATGTVTVGSGGLTFSLPYAIHP
ncbi:MAG: hypothetical protein KGR26_12025, partial [Cyanobacteria bacterium REEB65]|nr:hypothetical protein [Cyanobacteria bacterium REEB65]